MKHKLAAVRMNRNYDKRLVEELVLGALEPFGEFFEFTGVRDAVTEVTFEPSIGEDGVALWVMDLLKRRIEYETPDHTLVVMPHRIMTDSPGWGKGRVAFVSTHPVYMDPSDEKSFVYNGKIVAAHELMHTDPFNLEHHETRVRTRNGNCLMYVGRDADALQGIRDTAMGLCNNCYRTAALSKEKYKMFGKVYKLGEI